MEAGSACLVVGCGGVGLNIVQGAKLVGAGKIIAVDLLDNKLDYAKKFGATHTINGKTENVVKAVAAPSPAAASTTPSTPSVPKPPSLQDCRLPVRRRARDHGRHSPVTVKAGISPASRGLPGKTLASSFYGSIQPDIDRLILADLYMDKKIDLGP